MHPATPPPVNTSSTPSVNPGLRSLMRLMAWFMKYAPRSEDQPDMSGFSGVANIEVTGPVPYGWQVEIRDGRFQLRNGLHPQPQSVLRLSEKTFVQLLEGKSSFATALFTGRVRVEGEGHYNFVLASIVTGFRQMVNAQGRMGWLFRRISGYILKRAALPQPPAP